MYKVIGFIIKFWFLFSYFFLASQLFFLNFGLFGNTKRFLNTTPPKGDHLACLDGMRTLSIFWVMMGHMFAEEAGVLGLPPLVSNAATLISVCLMTL